MLDFNALVVASAVLVPIVTGLVQVIKSAGLNTFYAPALSVLLGIGLEFLAVGTLIDSPSVGITIILGAGVGLAASGAYSGVDRMSRPEDPTL